MTVGPDVLDRVAVVIWTFSVIAVAGLLVSLYAIFEK